MIASGDEGGDTRPAGSDWVAVMLCWATVSWLGSNSPGAVRLYCPRADRGAVDEQGDRVAADPCSGNRWRGVAGDVIAKLAGIESGANARPVGGGGGSRVASIVIASGDEGGDTRPAGSDWVAVMLC